MSATASGSAASIRIPIETPDFDQVIDAAKKAAEDVAAILG